ncbi:MULTISPECIES: ABC transporter substrate-binding protein [Cylindrospermopsis]|jgi:peptide/nickel transport system substrate-binding protein|uniref:ABC transporter substrate-binding protein n=1 Tax=Cylindrospermopsis TaxID=77021 RepID=UPI00070EE3F6|nr:MULTISPECIES: ABC transporter substrate-binding protein [Cylindrospermopsis]KRH96898.1 peptide ABC transporter substrate-binding protein [Cylindrospermopsis sp. CR12]MBU6344531.1 ABC transporter substrate-binding protein [Cyanobacteria bacterium REEB494]UJL35138.1 peptide ABC transporter substrate-binding protein [Cylindrospermopsis raciborskii Cr2010]UJS04685.1 ABC transporter substrate-binding protein [Cylindrospermopsis raciborskii KLL07]
MAITKFFRWLGKPVKFLSLFSLCFLLTISCSPTQHSNTPPQNLSADARITIGTTAKPRTLDPADAYELASLGLIFNMSDRLYTYNPGSTEIQPQLATSLPKVSADGLTYTIPLRKDVVFHDGTPFNAKAMEFSIQRFIENKGKPSFLLSDTIDSVKATKEHELTIRLKKPFAAFPALLAFSGVCPVSPKSYQIGAGKFQPNIFVGTGPYKLQEYGADSLKFDVFDQYWGEKPANKGINVQIQSSPVNLFNAFKTGAFDVAYLSLQPDQIRSLEEGAKTGNWQAITAQGSVVSYMVLNRNQQPLDQPEVRKAIASLVNRSLLNDRVLYGQADPLYSMIPTTFNVSQPLFKNKYGDGEFDRAKNLLTAAGFSVEKPAKIQVWYPSSSPTRSLVAQTLKSLADTKMGGILQLEIKTVEGATFFKEISKGSYPIALLDWYPDFLDPDNYVQPFLACEQGSESKGCEKGGSQTQGAFYYSQTMNKLIDQQRQEQNPEARKKIFNQIQNLVLEDVPYIPLWQNKDYVFAQKGVNNVQLDPTQNLIYKNIKK